MSTNIDHYRRSARRLKRDFAQGKEEAGQRLRRHVAASKEPRHADFLHVIARENGFRSWPDLKFSLEARGLTRTERADRLRRALYFGQLWIIQKLLEDEPDLHTMDFGLLVATYDLKAVQLAVQQDPAIATRMVGARSPILHLAYSHYFKMSVDREAAMLEVAALLLANGADVNDGFPSEPGSEHRLSALYGAMGHAGNMTLARWLLEHGADPNDNESLYHSTELGHCRGLGMLLEFGASPHGTNALPRAMDFNDEEAVRLLLKHGADPNEAGQDHPSGQPVDSIPALHHAAKRMCSGRIVDLLLDGGANAETVWEDHTPFALASIYGNRDMMAVLSNRGHAFPLNPVEAMLAACADGAIPASRIDMTSLAPSDRQLLTQLVWRPGALDQVKALVAIGLDPNAVDAMGLTPLHVAGWEGLSDYVEFFLTLQPDLSYRNGYGGRALDTVIHGAEFCPQALERDHLQCAALLLDAGAEFDPDWITNCGNEEMVMFLQSWSQERSVTADP